MNRNLLKSLELENQRFLNIHKRPVVVFIIFACFIYGLYSWFLGIVLHNFYLYVICSFMGISVIIYQILKIWNLKTKDTILDEFFSKNHLLVLEEVREISKRNSFEYSKIHLLTILKELSVIIITFRHKFDIECTHKTKIDLVKYKITYKVVENNNGIDIQTLYNFTSKEKFYLDTINLLYKSKKSRRKKSKIFFKVLKIETDY